jgi:chitinase
LEFANLGNSPDYGIADNDCVPTFKNAKHPGYALFNNDIYFDTHADEKALQPTYLLGPSGVTKRWVEGVGLVVAEGNSTRVATPKELQEELPFESCADKTCSREMEALKRVVQT